MQNNGEQPHGTTTDAAPINEILRRYAALAVKISEHIPKNHDLTNPHREGSVSEGQVGPGTFKSPGC